MIASLLKIGNYSPHSFFFLFGSIAQHVILHAPCPVVTVQKYSN